MATLYDVLKTFKSTLTARTSVPSENIVLDDQEKAESTPSIVFEPFPTKVTFNDVGMGPDRVIRNTNDEVVDYEYDEFIEIRFDVTPIADSETDLLTVYEDVRQAFRSYEEWESPHDFHTDCESITVNDSSSSDPREMRGQSVNIFVLFTRVTSRWGDVTGEPTLIESIDMDLQDDGDVDYTVT